MSALDGDLVPACVQVSSRSLDKPGDHRQPSPAAHALKLSHVLRSRRHLTLTSLVFPLLPPQSASELEDPW